MGMLDAFYNLSPETNEGLLGMAAQLLQAGGPSRTPVGFGQTMGMGLQGFMQGRDNAQAKKMEREQAAQLAAMRQLQMRNLQGDVEEQERGRSEARAIQDVLRGGVGADGGLGDNAAVLAQIRAINPMKAAEIERMFAKAGPEYDTTPQWVNGPDGKPVLMQMSKTAMPRMIDGVSPREKLEFRDGGGAVLGLDAYTGEAKAKLGKSMAPGEAARLGIERAQLGLSAQRLAMDKAAAGKPTFSAEAGGFILPPTASNPTGKLIPLAGVPGKAPTEFQGKSAAFGLRATEADKIISGLEGKYSPTSINAKASIERLPLIGGALGAASNFGMSDAEQRAEQAQRDFVNAILRQESGAAIGPDEFNNARKQYFPQPGDGAAVVKQKARNRALAIQGLQSNAGRAAMSAPGAQPAAAPAGGVKFLGFE